MNLARSGMSAYDRRRGVRHICGLGLRQPSAFFASGLVEAGSSEPGRMDAHCHAALYGLLRERSGPLSDLVWTLEDRGESRHEHTGGDGLGRESQLFVQGFVPFRD